MPELKKNLGKATSNAESTRKTNAMLHQVFRPVVGGKKIIMKKYDDENKPKL